MVRTQRVQIDKEKIRVGKLLPKFRPCVRLGTWKLYQLSDAEKHGKQAQLLGQ